MLGGRPPPGPAARCTPGQRSGEGSGQAAESAGLLRNRQVLRHTWSAAHVPAPRPASAVRCTAAGAPQAGTLSTRLCRPAHPSHELGCCTLHVQRKAAPATALSADYHVLDYRPEVQSAQRLCRLRQPVTALRRWHLCLQPAGHRDGAPLPALQAQSVLTYSRQQRACNDMTMTTSYTADTLS